MNCDREEDILYLAHQLWEESDEPKTTQQGYWQRAARQVLARHPGARSKVDAPTANGRGKLNTPRHQSHAQSGFIVRIDLGTAPAKRGVTLIKRCDSSKVANLAGRLARLAD